MSEKITVYDIESSKSPYSMDREDFYREQIQELNVPSIVTPNSSEFSRTRDLLKDHLHTISIIQHIDSKIINMEKIIEEEKIIIANKKNVFFGVYEGPIKMVDRESSGVLQYSINDLRKKIDSSPEMFTYDLKKYLDLYKSEFNSFLNNI